MKATVILSEAQQRALLNAIRAVESFGHLFLADDLRRQFEYDLANLKQPTDEERARIAYASMH